MKEIIKIEKNNFNGDIKESVSARELYSRLTEGDMHHYAEWANKNIVNNEFAIVHDDWELLKIKADRYNPRPTADYLLSIDFAKKLCMMSRTQNGDRIREYFIECETVAKNATTLPQKIDSRFLQMITNQMAELEKKIEQDKPKVEFYETVAESKDTIDIGEVAKVLKLPFGRNKLFEFLRNNGTLNNKNVPYQKFIDREYFKVIETTYSIGGQNKIYLKTLVTQKGLEYLSKMFKTFALIENDNN